MANVIIPNEQRKADTERIMKSYGANRKDPAMREAAEIAAVETRRAFKKAETRRRYY